MLISSSTNFIPDTQLTLQSAGIDLSFYNLTYSVQVEAKDTSNRSCFNAQKQQKTIIHNVSGIFKAGEISAIVGASGAGKTTLLNLVACRIKLQNGQLLVNNTPYNYQQFGNFANYVMQNDILMATLTVRETLEFAANLKLDCTDEEKKIRVQKLSKQLKLEKCMDTLVGSHLIKGISGGEKKRTSIAFELISDPDVLILDEPTSGLDSLTSFIIVQYLQYLARQKNKTIIMTIHQPNSDIFNLFDRLFLMVEGRLVYQGPSINAVNYFQRNLGLRCPDFYNPADYFITITHHEDEKNVRRYSAYNSQYEYVLQPKVARQIQSRRKDEISRRKVKLSLFTTYKQLVGRDFKTVVREPLMARSRFFQTTILYIYTGGLYYQNFSGRYTDQTAFTGLSGFFFFVAANSLMIAMVPLTVVFPRQREIFLKEENAKMYSTTAYFLSRNTIELPYTFIFPLLQIIIVYWFVGLAASATQFFICFLILYLLCFNGMSLGLFIGSIIFDPRTMTILSPTFYITISVFSGYYKNIANYPEWIGWLQYLSPVRYGFEAFVRNQTQFADSLIGELNFTLTLWLSIGLLVVLGVALRILSLFSLWLLRSKLQ